MNPYYHIQPNQINRLPPLRKKEIQYIIDEITNNKTINNKIVLNEIIDVLGRNFFTDFRLTNKLFVNYLKDFKVSPPELIQLMQLCNKFNENHFKNFRELCLSTFKDNVKEDRILKYREIFFATFLREIDHRIQLIYKLYLYHGVNASKGDDNDISTTLKYLKPVEPYIYRLLNIVETTSLLKGWFLFEDYQYRIKILLSRLSNFIFPVTYVNFRFTHHCNIQCKHCYNHSGPSRNSLRLNIDSMLRMIDQMPDTGVDKINLAGGEPFLYPDTLFRLISKAREKKIKKVNLITNGFWAKSESFCKNRLNALERSGFMTPINGLVEDSLMVSSGIYHQEYIPFSTITNLILSFFDTFNKPIFLNYEIPGINEKKEISEVELLLKRKGLFNKVKLLCIAIEPAGRAGKIKELTNFKKANDLHSCNSIDQIVFDPDGTCRPCCGLNAHNNGIVIGDIRKELKSLIKELQNNSILQFIAKNPVGNIFKYVNVMPHENRYIGTCSVCNHALGNLKDGNTLKKKLLSAQNFYPFWFSIDKMNASSDRF